MYIALREQWVSTLQFLLLPPSQGSTTTEEGRAEPAPASLCTHRCTNPGDLSNVSHTVLLPTWDYYFTNKSSLSSKNGTLFLYILFLHRLKD